MEPAVVTPVPAPISVDLKRCISPQERSARRGCFAVSGLAWIILIPLTVLWFGIPVLVFLLRLVSEAYLTRKLRANLVRVRASQFPSIHEAYEACRKSLGIQDDVDIYIMQSGELNAFSLGLMRKRVVVLNSTALEGTLQEPAQLRFLLGHELTHAALDKTFAGRFLLYRSAKLKAGREATCDRAGAACAGDSEAATAMLKRLFVGNWLFQEVAEEPLMEDGDEAKRGFLGWLLRQYSTYPTAGDRLRGVRAFVEELAAVR